MNYIDKVTNKKLKEYLMILINNNYPDFIDKYFDLDELKRLSNIDFFCGAQYTKILNTDFYYTRLDHSVAVALIVWKFTKNKKETITALFHDIGTPAFSHSIDFLMGDSVNHESSEKDAESILKKSDKLLELLEIDDLTLNDILDIDNCPILENKAPALCADRLDGVFSVCYMITHFWDANDLKNLYDNLFILKNEMNIDEIGFKESLWAEKFASGVNDYGMLLQSGEDKYTLAYVAHVVKKLVEMNKLTIDDLYIKSEEEIIDVILDTNEIKDDWLKFNDADKVYKSNEKPNNCFYCDLKNKKRYVLPLLNNMRAHEVNESIQKMYDEYLEYEELLYTFIPNIN